ncbi:MAG: 16S rRNA (adenine(1518)-N(6)/adenine(1519)-N(6))-dimethyltransferase RsmA [Methylococcales symbiont of Hymedesmia sp. n. MRB-2018]|nr:MAG: 16S rRNA (adenine(1518)-N(6)/adenine(1519)-N(6))-dimethyltransferase RsmA [Methylococcales symbiont of Hymedesmia sp. n. MRB-2018]
MAHKARKRFGQNFLQDDNIIYHILANIHANTGERWVEIGPGLGAITEPLLKEGIILDVVELDRDLVKFLDDKFRQYKNFTLHSADALNFDFSALAKENEKLRIIGNLPYNISTPLLFHLLDNACCIQYMYFMLQKEVVDRICADAGSKKYGRLSVMMQYFCATEKIFEVPPESFNPIPKVMSAIVKLTPHQKAPVKVNDLKLLNKVVTTAFSQRRKTIRNSLKPLISEEQLSAINIDPTLRAECISLAEFALISQHVQPLDEMQK